MSSCLPSFDVDRSVGNNRHPSIALPPGCATCAAISLRDSADIGQLDTDPMYANHTLGIHRGSYSFSAHSNTFFDHT